MDIEKWRVFLTVVEAGNLSTAATLLNISQSGISYIIKQLEDEVQFKLFDRSQWKGMTLTQAGQQVYTEVGCLLREDDRFEQSISQIRGGLEGSLHIGSIESAAICWLPQVLLQYKRDFPNVNVYIKEGGDDYVENALRSNQIDFAITSKKEQVGYEWIEISLDPIVALLPKGHHLESMSSIPLKFFETEPFIMPLSLFDYDVNNALTSNNISPKNIVCSSQNDHTILALVSAGVGCSLLYDCMVNTWDTKDIVIRNVEPFFARKLGIAIRNMEKASPAAINFIKYIQRIVPEYS